MNPLRPKGPLRHRGVLGLLFFLLAVMTGLTAYSPTLYRVFCAATGYGGTTQRVASNDATQSPRVITVRFTTSTAPGLPWRFVPAQKEVQLHLGEDALVFFEAENLSDQDLIGHATFNVTPEKAGIYFKKIECFCFTEEKLEAHKSVEMPVDFFVDPRLASDTDTTDIDTITLSYTFFPSARPDGAQDLARFGNTPNPEYGAKLFATNCAGCHSLDRRVVGPPLAGIVGRTAGSVAGYPYSEALAASHVTWTPETLDTWLAGPQRMVPGSLMPMSVADPATRRDIIAYLKSVGTTAAVPAAAKAPAPAG